MTQTSTRIVVSADDQASKVLRDVGNEAERLKRKLESTESGSGGFLGDLLGGGFTPQMLMASVVSKAVGSATNAISSFIAAESWAQKQTERLNESLKETSAHFDALAKEALSAVQNIEKIPAAMRENAMQAAITARTALEEEIQKLSSFGDIGVYESSWFGQVKPRKFSDEFGVAGIFEEFKELRTQFNYNKIAANEFGMEIGKLIGRLEKIGTKETRELVDVLRIAEERTVKLNAAQQQYNNIIANANLAKIGSMFDQLTLSPEEFKLAQLTKEIEQYRVSVQLAEDSTAAWKLSMLQASAEAGGFGSLSEMTKAYSAFFERIRILEEGDVDLRKAAAQQKHNIMTASLNAQREILEAEEALARSRLTLHREATAQEMEIWKHRLQAYGATYQADLSEIEAKIAQVDKALAALDRYSPDKLFGPLGGGGGKKGGSGSVAREAVNIIEQLTGKIQELRGKLTDDKAESFLGRFNREIASLEKSAAKLTGAKKDQFSTLLMEYKDLGSQYAAKEKDKELEKHMQVRLDFEREYADMVGLTAEAVSKSLQRQYDDYKKAGVDIVQLEEWKRDKIQRASREAFDGASVYLKDFSNEALNQAKNTTMVLEGMFDGMGRVFTLTTKGMKMDWNSMLDDMLNRAWQAMAMNPLMGGLAKGTNSLLGMLGLGGPTGASLGGFSTDASGFGWLSWHAKGNVFPGDTGLSDYLNSIVNQPTVFKFASGAALRNIGVMGEAGPEAIMPLTRMPSGDLGVRAAGASPNIQINVIDQRGANSPPVEVQQSQTADGGIQIDVLVPALENAFATRVANGTSQLARTLDATRGTSPNKQLYSK